MLILFDNFTCGNTRDGSRLHVRRGQDSSQQYSAPFHAGRQPSCVAGCLQRVEDHGVGTFVGVWEREASPRGGLDEMASAGTVQDRPCTLLRKCGLGQHDPGSPMFLQARSAPDSLPDRTASVTPQYWSPLPLARFLEETTTRLLFCADASMSSRETKPTLSMLRQHLQAAGSISANPADMGSLLPTQRRLRGGGL